MNKIIKFIEENIGEYNEIHISYEFSKEMVKFEEFKPIKIEQDVIGDFYCGDLDLSSKKVKVYSNILFEYDEIEFKN